MGCLLKNRRAQNTIEYALMLGIVIAVFSAMQLYFKRGMQSTVKKGIDNAPAQVLTQIPAAEQQQVQNLFATDEQYEPYYMVAGQSDMQTVSSEGVDKGTISESGGVRELENASSSRTGKQVVTGVAEAD